jgi:hypothetical protein
MRDQPSLASTDWSSALGEASRPPPAESKHFCQKAEPRGSAFRFLVYARHFAPVAVVRHSPLASVGRSPQT